MFSDSKRFQLILMILEEMQKGLLPGVKGLAAKEACVFAIRFTYLYRKSEAFSLIMRMHCFLFENTLTGWTGNRGILIFLILSLIICLIDRLFECFHNF